MIKILSALLVLTLWFVGLAYLGLLSNWFRYGLSLEGMFVSIPLVLGTAASSVLAILAHRRNSVGFLGGAFVGMGLTGLLVVAAQFRAFGEMPSLYANHVERSPTGRIITPQGEVEYLVELENPFAYGHNEYLVIRRHDKEYRLNVPMFNRPVAGYVSGSSATDWGQLETTAAPDIYLFRIGSYLPNSGSRFRINLATGVVETIQRTDG